MNPRLELVMLLEERRLSNFEGRKRRLSRISVEVAASGMLKLKANRGEPLTLEEYIGSHWGFLPGEWEHRERFLSSASPEPAPARPLSAAAIEAAPDHAADAGKRCEDLVLRSQFPLQRSLMHRRPAEDRAQSLAGAVVCVGRRRCLDGAIVGRPVSERRVEG